MNQKNKLYSGQLFEKVNEIADEYGYEPQSRQCIEEMAELTQAINKLWRKRKGPSPYREVSSTYDNVVEEMADVQIMIVQMYHLLEVDESEFRTLIERKINRQLERIKRSKENRGGEVDG